MDLHLYNDLTGTKEPFKPQVEGHVTFYVCGPTVYDYFHIGNARPFIVFDVLRRYMESKGLTVTYVQNFTDIDDKMIQRAEQLGITTDELAERNIAAYYEDADALGIKRASIYPRATREIRTIIALIEKLVASGHAYQAGGDVYFEVAAFKDYGKLSRQNLEDLHSGARVDVDERKHDPLDFVLWKEQKPGEPAWDSPWGWGRPGWHIECSAMAARHLGETIDIHAGGSDLIFPHHDNEIAQSEAAHGKQFARFWLHNGYIMIDQEKMSKSLGNFFTARDVLAEYHAPAVRLFMLTSHYRSPISFSPEAMEQATNACARLKNAWIALAHTLGNGAETGADTADEHLRGALSESRRDFDESMKDDFNTAGAIGAVFDLIRAVNTSIGSGVSDMKALSEAAAFLRNVDDVMGVLQIEAIERELTPCNESEIDELIASRVEARKKGDYALSDKIRDDLRARGIILEDTPQGTRWKRAD